MTRFAAVHLEPVTVTDGLGMNDGKARCETVKMLLKRSGESQQYGAGHLFADLVETMAAKARVPGQRIGAIQVGEVLIETEEDVAQLKSGDGMRVRLKLGAGDEGKEDDG